MNIAIVPARRTLAEEPAQLADEIVRGTLQPGTALDEMEPARRFGVSRTPVREAIRQPRRQRLVRGARSPRRAGGAPSVEHLVGMFEAMAELEVALCAGLAAERMTRAERTCWSSRMSRCAR